MSKKAKAQGGDQGKGRGDAGRGVAERVLVPLSATATTGP